MPAWYAARASGVSLLEVLLRVEGIADAVGVGDDLHYLHESHGPRHGDRVGLEVRFYLYDALHQQGIDALGAREALDDRVVAVAQGDGTAAP